MGVGFGGRQLHEQRTDPVAERQGLAGLSHADRNHRTQPPPIRLFPPRLEQPAKTAHRRGEGNVVHGPAQLALDRLQLLQPNRDLGHTSVAPDRDVEARPGRTSQLIAHQQLGYSARAGEQFSQLSRVKREIHAGTDAAGDQREGAVDAVLDVRRRLESLQHPLRLGARLGLGIEHQANHRGTAHPVHQAVVDLDGNRPSPVAQPVEQRHLPQRARAVETPGVEAGEPLEQLPLTARLRDGGVRHVSGDLELLVGDPGRPAQGADVRRRQPAAKAGQK